MRSKGLKTTTTTRPGVMQTRQQRRPTETETAKAEMGMRMGLRMGPGRGQGAYEGKAKRQSAKRTPTPKCSGIDGGRAATAAAEVEEGGELKAAASRWGTMGSKVERISQIK